MPVSLGTPLSPHATRVLLLGSGELGKEVVLELQRFGVEVIACDRYGDAPAMQVAHRSHVLDMLDRAAVRRVIEAEQPHLIVPEIETIATAELVALEAEGWTVLPTAEAARLTMDREAIRRVAAEELGLPTARYRFADTAEELTAAARELGWPVVIKPIMSSSGKGQSVARTEADLAAAWAYAQTGGRTGAGRVIVEAFVAFDSEITMLTVRAANGTAVCAPIGHRQVGGDYVESWQPHAMSPVQVERAQDVARRITDRLGGRGVFGVELLLLPGDEVMFSEVSPRPHDTGTSAPPRWPARWPPRSAASSATWPTRARPTATSSRTCGPADARSSARAGATRPRSRASSGSRTPARCAARSTSRPPAPRPTPARARLTMFATRSISGVTPRCAPRPPAPPRGA